MYLSCTEPGRTRPAGSRARQPAKRTRRGGRAHLARAHLVLQLLEVAGRALAALEGGKQPMLENLAHPGGSLRGAAFIEPA